MLVDLPGAEHVAARRYRWNVVVSVAVAVAAVVAVVAVATVQPTELVASADTAVVHSWVADEADAMVGAVATADVDEVVVRVEVDAAANEPIVDAMATDVANEPDTIVAAVALVMIEIALVVVVLPYSQYHHAAHSIQLQWLSPMLPPPWLPTQQVQQHPHPCTVLATIHTRYQEWSATNESYHPQSR